MSDAAHQAVDLWLPDLARFAPDHPLRTLLRKADALAPGARGYLAGLAQRFDVPQPIAAGALTRDFLCGDAGQGAWLCADPAWVQPDLNGARLLAYGQMQLSADDAHALAEPLLPVFEEVGMALHLSSPNHWHVRLPPGDTIPTFAAPEQALGEDLYHHLPQGDEGRRWRILLNDVQVILHQHPLNAERRQRGLPPVNHLWLWGGGVLPSAVHASYLRVVGDDLLLAALAKRAGIATTTRTTASLAEAMPGTLVDLEDVPVGDIAVHWMPALQALVARHAVQWSFASGERWLHRPWHRMRFWRGGR